MESISLYAFSSCSLVLLFGHNSGPETNETNSVGPEGRRHEGKKMVAKAADVSRVQSLAAMIEQLHRELDDNSAGSSYTTAHSGAALAN